MFMLAPPSGFLPPVGARLEYEVVVDAKTGRPRAENVRKEGLTRSSQASPVPHVQETRFGPDRRAGTLVKDNGKFGFIQQDCGEEDMFMLPPEEGVPLPPLGARLTYDVVEDAKTGRPRAANVVFESGHDAQSPVVPTHRGRSSGLAAHRGDPIGTLVQDNGKFGFIKQDSGEEDMFVLTQSVGSLPPVGTRVSYSVVMDAKTGRPRAENMQIIDDSAGYGKASHAGKGKNERSAPYRK